MKQNIRCRKYYKYQIIEYDYVSMHYEEGDTKIEVCKTRHKTNSKLLYLLIILIFACLFNVVSKIVKRYALKEELESAAQYMEEQKVNEENSI